ncbi:aspartate racemase-like isoform X3 [Mangifera indica]|uniref:aspartate racemase-like isoform X3 n=1 Tax=Mangifera indica TaxID=29780 RepID=UPI001CFB7701|nr:aspartate racemase-like isoform X3 [Mangifera indica]XP_044471679.1 aspartate racemase-like isoform X3 [Mangifera indica]
MFDGGMFTSSHTVNCPSVFLSNLNKNKTQFRARTCPSAAVQSSPFQAQISESRNLRNLKKFSGSYKSVKRANTVGIIGGVSVSATLSFLEKLVRWSSKDAKECVPFVLCYDPELKNELFHSLKRTGDQNKSNRGFIVENLLHKRSFLEQFGARCIVMPCHVSHAWHEEISEGCSVPFLHIGECVTRELKEAKLKPLEPGSGVRIGVLATHETLTAGIYQEQLESQGFEVVLPDAATMEHIIIPIIETMNRGDIEGAQNLLRIAIHVLLVRAVNAVILASDEMQGLLPDGDPLLKKRIDPMDALARSTVNCARSNQMSLFSQAQNKHTEGQPTR